MRVEKQREVFMACISCGSEKRAEFGAEMNIHFPGIKGLNKPAVWVFPKLMVCFGCGQALLKIPGTQLRQLEDCIAA